MKAINFQNDCDQGSTEPVGPGSSGSVLVSGADQDQETFKKTVPDWTRAKKNFKTWDRIGPGPIKI